MAQQSRTQNWQSSPSLRQQQWHELRDELEDLLDQIVQTDEQTHSDTSPRPSSAVPAEHFSRPASASGRSSRHHQALRNVQTAVDRLSDHEELAPMPTHTRQGLHDAIEQIRSTRSGGRREERSYRRDSHERQSYEHRPHRDWSDEGYARDGGSDRRAQDMLRQEAHLAELSDAIGDIGARLQRFDSLLSSNALPSSHLEEVAVQIEQLTSIVEVLAGKVTERGAFDAIERQIASLSETVERDSKLDITSVETRLDQLAQSFAQLSNLQAEHNQQIKAGLNGDQAQQHYATIEDGVRNIYDRLDSLAGDDLQASLRGIFDRIDQLEKNVGAPTPLLERLTRDVAELNNTIRANKGPAVASVIGTRVDALNDRISEIENAAAKAGPAKMDMDGLRETLNSALNERFAAIDTKIGGIANSLKSRAVKLESSPQLEAQIRNLTEQLEKTSTDLDHLRAQQAESGSGATGNGSAGLPDFETIAELIAKKTGAEMDRSNSQTTKRTSEMLEAFEGKVAGLLSSAGQLDAKGPDLSGVEQGLKGVNARLARLESSLNNQDAGSVGIKVDAGKGNVEAAEIRDADAAQKRPAHPGLFGGDAKPDMQMSHMKQNIIPELRDRMPRSPADDAPLNAPAFPDPAPEPVMPKPEARKSVPVPGMLHEPEGSDALTDDKGASADKPQERHERRFDTHNVTPPPQPKSTLLQSNHEEFVPTGERKEDPQNAEPVAPNSLVEKEELRDFGQRPQNPIRDQLAQPKPEQDHSVSRSTFIAAARRAAQASNPGVEETQGQSVIGRALSRFQRKKEQIIADEPDMAQSAGQNGQTSEPEPQDEKPRLGRFHMRRKKSEAEREALDKQSGLIAESADGDIDNNDVAFDDDDELDIIQQSESFLSRNSRPILLGLTLVAVSMMTLNLVSQRLGSENLRLAGSAGAPQLIEGETVKADVDMTEVGSINGQADPASQDIPSPVRLVAPATDTPISPESLDESDMVSLDNVSLTDMTPLAQPAAGEMQNLVSMPPEAVGPLGLREAAADGDAHAMFEVASILSEGRTIAQDLGSAAKWYERSALTGFAPAAYYLANMYENGTGVEADPDQAVYWYKRAAETGNRMAMHNLAAMYASGAMGEQDFTQAAFWFERGAALGLTDSQFNLGMLHARGLGVPQDLSKSFLWFSIAAEGGDADAAKARDDVARSLGAETVTLMQNKVARWTAQEMDIPANFAPIGTWSNSFDPGAAIENQQVILRVQTALGRLGFDVGDADGLIGPKTTDAIKAFEQATGMSPSGEVNPRLLAVLGSQPV